MSTEENNVKETEGACVCVCKEGVCVRVGGRVNRGGWVGWRGWWRLRDVMNYGNQQALPKSDCQRDRDTKRRWGGKEMVRVQGQRDI